MLKWTKLGLIFKPSKSLYWQHSHAALPTRLQLNDSLYRIFFTSRDKYNRAYIGWFDLDLVHPTLIRDCSEYPVLVPGDLGFFDDHGVQATSVIRLEDGTLYLYYLGWNTSGSSPLFYSSIGLAISTDSGHTFKKYSPAPILQRSRFDPWMVSGGTVLCQESRWIMYYLSGFKYEIIENKAISWYNVKIAISDNGINWRRDGRVALDLHEGETNISRMTISYHNNSYHSWFPYKQYNQNYQCGYAQSKDGYSWVRSESCALPSSNSNDWDSGTIDKMEVIHYRSRLYMLYNGCNYGYDGIGIAYADI